LRDIAAKGLQDRLNFVTGQSRHRTLFQNLAFRIGGGGFLSQPHAGTVDLVGVQQMLGKLGGLSEADRQQAGSQRVKTAGMAGFFSLEQPTDFLQGLIGGHAFGLVEQENTVERTARALGFAHNESTGSADQASSLPAG